MGLRRFLDICLTGEHHCLSCVREYVRHDRAMWHALAQPLAYSPRDLATHFSERFATIRRPGVTPRTDQTAVGFFARRGLQSCAVHIPGSGWWALSVAGGITPVSTSEIITAFEVRNV